MFDWPNYLNLSRTLNESTDEASLRASVSKAYYAVFNMSRNKLIELDTSYVENKYGDSHRDIINKFKNNDKQVAKSLAVHLNKLKQKRVNSDYKESFNVDQRYSADAIKTAELIIEKLSLIDETYF
jgi:uncharacterized protein (UPF0332 family)